MLCAFSVMNTSVKKTEICDFIEYFSVIAQTLPTLPMTSKGKSALRSFSIIAPLALKLLHTICAAIFEDKDENNTNQ